MRVDVPDAAGREAILKVHTRKMKLENVDVLRAVAELTPGERSWKKENGQEWVYGIYIPTRFSDQNRYLELALTQTTCLGELRTP